LRRAFGFDIHQQSRIIMSVTRVGTTKKFADNWDKIFGGKKKKSSAPTTKKSTKKKANSKTTGKKKKARR
jgi:hypothetical protein